MDIPLAPSEQGQMKTSINVKEQNATSNKSRTFNIVIGYFCLSALPSSSERTLAHLSISDPSSRNLYYHHPIYDYLQYMPDLRWTYTLVCLLRFAWCNLADLRVAIKLITTVVRLSDIMIK